MMIGGEVTMAKMPKEKPRLHLRFPKGAKVQPKGFESVSVGDTVIVAVKGKITELRDTSDDWDPGKSFGLLMTSCKIQGPGKKVSVDDAVKSAQRKV